MGTTSPAAGSVHPGEGEDGPGEVSGELADDAVFVDEERFEERDPRWLCVIGGGEGAEGAVENIENRFGGRRQGGIR